MNCIYDVIVDINKDEFLSIVYLNSSSIRKLGNKVGRSEKTIRNYLNDGRMPLEILLRCLTELGVDIRDTTLTVSLK